MKPEEAPASAPTTYDPSAMGGDPTAMLHALGPYFAVFAIIGLLIGLFMLFCWWKIFAKAGYSGALSLVFLTAIIPLIGPLISLVFFIWFAFAQWPVLKGGGAPMKT